MFALEKLRDNYSPKGFLKQRENRARPILESLQKRLRELSSRVPSELAFGKASAYALDTWGQLVKYLEQPELTPPKT